MHLKTHLIPTTIMLLSTCLYASANYVAIECTFPCVDSDNVCAVSNTSIRCEPRTETTKWVLKDTMSLPEYQGALISLGQSCTLAPHPALRDASRLSKNSSETCLNWPPNDRYDSYYSNCADNLYCDRAHICVKQLAHGEPCESDNQCLDGICSGNTCMESPTISKSSGANTVHIIASVVGVAIFLGVLVGIYFFWRRRRNRRLAREKDEAKEQSVLPKHNTAAATTTRSNTSSSNNTTNSTAISSASTLNNNTNSNHYSPINMLHPNYDSNYHHHDSNTTPSMQQQHLQYQLQRLSDKTSSPPTTAAPVTTTAQNPDLTSPPPYSP